MNIKFAFAVNNVGFLQKNHFGDAEKYFIYELKGNKIIFEQELANSYENLDEKITVALTNFTKEVKAVSFPNEKYIYNAIDKKEEK